eukprot:scaffold12510_cov20-Tisochrysis_lutea.AAC.7
MHHAHPDSAGPHNPPLHLQQQQQQHLHKQHAAGADGKGAGSKDPKAAGNKSGWAAGPDLECRALLRVEPLGGASAGADAASAMPSHPSPAPACGTATVHGTYEQHVQEGSMARPLRAAVLHPGWNRSHTPVLHIHLRLTFLAAPVVPGLCLVHHMSALLGTCTLRIQATPPSLRRFLHCPASPPPLPPPPTAGHSGVPGAMSAGVVDLGEWPLQLGCVERCRWFLFLSSFGAQFSSFGSTYCLVSGMQLGEGPHVQEHECPGVCGDVVDAALGYTELPCCS